MTAKKIKPLKKTILVNVRADNGRKVRVLAPRDGAKVSPTKRYIVGVQLTLEPGPTLRIGRGAFVPAYLTRAALRDLRNACTRALGE